MKQRLQIVLDTNVFVSALRSRRGTAFRLLSLIDDDRFQLNLSVPLVLEYEEVARRLEWLGKPPWNAIEDILDYVCCVGKHQRIHFLWRPHERDPKDDMVLEVAVAGHCSAIVTYNKKDFPCAASFGVKLLTPREFLKLIGEKP